VNDVTRLPLLSLPPGDGPFDLLDFVGHYSKTLIGGVGWVPTILIPSDGATLARLDAGEALRGANSAMVQSHRHKDGTRHTCQYCKAHAAAPAKPAAMAEAEAAGAAAAAAHTKKYRGKGQLHDTMKSTSGYAHTVGSSCLRHSRACRSWLYGALHRQHRA